MTKQNTTAGNTPAAEGLTSTQKPSSKTSFEKSMQKLIISLLAFSAVAAPVKMGCDWRQAHKNNLPEVMTSKQLAVIMAGTENRIYAFEYNYDNNETWAYDKNNQLVYKSKKFDDRTEQCIVVDGHTTITNRFFADQQRHTTQETSVTIDGKQALILSWGAEGKPSGRLFFLSSDHPLGKTCLTGLNDSFTRPHPLPDPFTIVPESSRKEPVSVTTVPGKMMNRPLIIGIP